MWMTSPAVQTCIEVTGSQLEVSRRVPYILAFKRLCQFTEICVWLEWPNEYNEAASNPDFNSNACLIQA